MTDRPTAAWVVFPGDPVDAGLVGGKAAALHTLFSHGVPVPPFAVVTTAAFREGREPLDERLVASVLAAAAITAGEAGRLAVRSSATVEDRPHASFAGQFRSVLDVPVPDGVMPALQSVWASLTSEAARRYRASRAPGGDDADADEPAMAVVLMRHVPARRSGVAFTGDPTAGPAWIRVESVEGTADRLVSGAATPDVVRVARDAPTVSDPVIADVVRWALRCEEVFGAPQDVEWVWDGERVLVVQSRPITAFADATPQPADPAHEVTTAGIGEMLPGVLAPLVADTAVTAVDHAISGLLHRLGALPTSLPAMGGIVVCADHRAGLRVDLLADAARQLPSTTPERLQDQLLGRAHVERGDVAPASWRRRLAHDLRVVRIRRRTATDAEIVLAAVDAMMDAPPSTTVSTLSLEERWTLCRRMADLFLRTVETEVATAALATAAFDRLVAFLMPYAPDDAASLATELTRRGVRSPMVMRWIELAERWHRQPLGRQLLGETSWDVVRARLDRTAPEAGVLLDDLMCTVRRAGSRAVPGGQTWDADLAAVWTAVRAASTLTRHPETEPRGGVPEPVWDRMTRSPAWRRRRLLTGWVIDSQAIALRRHVREATVLLNTRERLKDAVMSVGGELHRLQRTVGTALVASGWLQADDEVFTLSMAALAQRVAGGDVATASSMPVTANAANEVLEGWAASGGSYEGWARVVGAADDPFVPGEILVARTTDPSWSPLFMAAGALVVEQGGLLSHAAVIARELGLPAVVNVPGVTARVITGMRLHVDGRTGRVTIVGEAGHGPTTG